VSPGLQWSEWQIEIFVPDLYINLFALTSKMNEIKSTYSIYLIYSKEC
jgi:hypothetical protein